MNHRVLELLKTPKNIQSEDLNLLKEEINSFPYVQNIRALYLYGVHLYDKDNYQKVLSTTAAYTTDKKILYQLINGKIQQKPKAEIQPEIVKEKIIPTENPLKVLYQAKTSNFPIKREETPIVAAQPEIIEEPKEEILDKKEETFILPTPKEEVKPVYVNGERNRILFEGEENFLEDNNVETIDLESTLESGSIVTQKIEKKEDSSIIEENVQEEVSDKDVQPEVVEEIQEFTPETIIEEEKITSEPEKEEILNESEVSFHEIENDLESEVKSDKIEDEKEPESVVNDSENLNINKSEEVAEFTPETIIDEEEINSETEKEEVLDGSELSFHETESFLPDVQVSANDFEEVKESETGVNESERSEIKESEEIAEFTPEKIINEDKISSEKEEKAVQDESELSFHGMESFLPDVKIQANEEETISEIPQQNLNKHEDEMRRLIEEVEKKMKEKAASEKIQKEEEPENIGHDISFAETQSFEVTPSESKPEDKIQYKNSDEEVQNETIEEPKTEVVEEKNEPTEEKSTKVESAWKPMSLESNLPDSLLDKQAKVSQPIVEAETLKTEIAQEEVQKEETPKQKEILPEVEEISELVEDKSEEFGEQTDELQIDEQAPKIGDETKEEVPVMNVSFFGSGWTIAEPARDNNEKTKQEVREEKSEKTPVETPKPNLLDSNVPGFINTWQSWLKIDRAEEVKEIEKEKIELKNKVIETFIETNPRISQLKDEVSFVVKEKNDDISHLMTETLATLYFEQKLYTKAIKAFEILIKKTPEKKEYYEAKIQEIKNFRSKG